MKQIIIARFHGKCLRCKAHIYPNQKIVKECGGYSHPVCVPDEEED